MQRNHLIQKSSKQNFKIVTFHLHTPFFSISKYTLPNFNLDMPKDNGRFRITEKKSQAPIKNVILHNSVLLTVLKYPNIYER